MTAIPIGQSGDGPGTAFTSVERFEPPVPKPLYSLSPQELADQGIPVEVALRALIEASDAERQGYLDLGAYTTAGVAAGVSHGLRKALAIIEAQR